MLLVLLLVSVLWMSVGNGTGAPRASEPGAVPAPGPVEEEAPPATQPPEPREPAADKPQVPATGNQNLRTAAFTREAPDGQQGRRVRVQVQVEEGLPLDPEKVARETADVLQDERSWNAKGVAKFDFVGTGPADLTINVLTPGTTDEFCLPLRTLGEVSCSTGNKVNLNARRWVEAVPDFNGDIPLYRQYLVNHEVGHYLGRGHVGCPGRGQPAPVMMQQTKGVGQCRPNAWP